MPTRPSRSSLLALGLGALLLLPAPATAQWQPDRFQMWCGTAATFMSSGWMNMLRMELGGELIDRHPKDYRFYLDNLGQEVDEPAPGCLEDDRRVEMEGMARHAFLGLKAVGQAQGLQFTDPSPVRLGPVVLDEAGERRTRLYLDPTFDGIGQTNLKTGSGGDVLESWGVAHVRFDPEDMAADPAWSRYRAIAHELVHVIESAQQLMSPKTDAFPSDWIYEGVPDALAGRLTRDRYSGAVPITVRGARPLYGLRPYNRSLTWVSSSERDRWGNYLITHYTASSFWTYLADRFFDGSFHYLIDWFAVPDPHEGRDDWLEWTDDLLRYDDGGIDHPLYLVFPDFIANYAAWGEKKYPHIGEEDWQIEAFDQCEIVTLTPGDRPADLAFELEPLAAKCVKVMVGGLASDDAVSVQFMAYDGDTDRLDNLHLVMSRMSNTVGGVTFECYDESRTMGPNSLCLHKPFTGARGRTLSPSDMGGVTGSGGDFVKTWLGTEQMTGGEGLIENTYFMVHTPVEPRDAEHDVQQGGQPQPVRLQVGLERSKVVMAGTGETTASAAVNGSAALGLVPMKGGDAEGGGPMDLAGSVAAAMEGAMDPEAMSRTMFLQNQPTGTILPNATTMAPCDGVCMVNLMRVEPRPDGYGGHELATTASIGLSPEEAIPWGATGSFKAMVSACPEEECDEGIGVGEGTITVSQFDDGILRLSVAGSYCVFRGIASLTCPDPQTFSGEVVKPFGWAYAQGRGFNSIDTPGMAEYREYLTKALAELMPGTVTVWRKQLDGLPGEEPIPSGEGGGDAGGGGGGSGGAVAPACDCSCDGYNALMEAVETYQAALQAAAAAGQAPPPQPPAMQSFMRCSMECAQQWGMCGR